MGAQRRVLIIDDEPHVLEILRSFSETLGYVGDTASSGDEAIKMIAPGRHWAMLCDLKMPGINGVEIFERISQVDKNLSKRFVMVTGTIFENEISPHTLLEKGVIFLRKPFLFKEMKNTFEILEKLDTKYMIQD